MQILSPFQVKQVDKTTFRFIPTYLEQKWKRRMVRKIWQRNLNVYVFSRMSIKYRILKIGMLFLFESLLYLLKIDENEKSLHFFREK